MQIYLIRHAQSENNALDADSIHTRKVDPTSPTSAISNATDWRTGSATKPPAAKSTSGSYTPAPCTARC